LTGPGEDLLFRRCSDVVTQRVPSSRLLQALVQRHQRIRQRCIESIAVDEAVSFPSRLIERGVQRIKEHGVSIRLACLSIARVLVGI